VSMVNAKLRGAVQIIIKGNGTILAFMTDTPEFEGLLSWTLHGIADSLAAGGKN